VPAIISKSIIKLKSQSVFFIHISTDQVYSGTGNHHEADVGPINAYGSSKLAGELMIHYPKTAILRVNFYGMSQQLLRPSFTDWIVRSLRKSDQVTFFNNIRFNGLHHSTLCNFIESVMRRELEGTYNIGCRDALSKADFAIALAQKLNLDFRHARIAEYVPSSCTATRPYDMTMNVNKIELLLNIKCPLFQEEIDKTAREYSNAEF
jgi:dTDP-4-dehydrorhamnose reductase